MRSSKLEGRMQSSAFSVPPGIRIIMLMLAAMMMLSFAVLAAPVAFDVDVGTPMTKGFFAAGMIGAQGGNDTFLNASAETQTLAWQGFYGEVFGDIALADNSCDKLYEWLGGSQGLVFASRDSNINWAAIAPQNDCTIDESLTGTLSDRVNRTFSQSSNRQITIGGITINANTACAMNTYVNSTPQNASFEEMILTDDGGTTAIYTTPLENDIVGFDGQTHDFQIIVPDHINRTTTTYYFYAEIQ